MITLHSLCRVVSEIQCFFPIKGGERGNYARLQIRTGRGEGEELERRIARNTPPPRQQAIPTAVRGWATPLRPSGPHRCSSSGGYSFGSSRIPLHTV